MMQLAEPCQRRSPRYLPQRPRPAAWSRRTVDLHSQAEAMLREMAFVYQAARSVRESMIAERAR
jgi:hypothetical protein